MFLPQGSRGKTAWWAVGLRGFGSACAYRILQAGGGSACRLLVGSGRLTRVLAGQAAVLQRLCLTWQQLGARSTRQDRQNVFGQSTNVCIRWRHTPSIGAPARLQIPPLGPRI